LYGNYVPLRRQYPVVVHALERLQSQGDDKAGQFLASIMRLNDLSVVALAIGMVNKTHTCSFINIVSIEAGAVSQGG
jgi:hypothetical protein